MIGGATAAIQGDNILKGMAMGAVTGAFMGAAGPLTYAGDALFAVESFATHNIIEASVYAGLGAASGAINTAISGGNVGIGALSGGLFGLAGSVVGVPDFEVFGSSKSSAWAGMANRFFNTGPTGGGYGAAYAAMSGGNIMKGAASGALGWMAGDAANMAIGHSVGFVGSGFKAPQIRDGAFVYPNNPGGHLSFGNVIWEHSSGMTPSQFKHELSGHGFQTRLLSPAYLPSHLLDKMTFSLVLEYSKTLLGGAPTYYDLYPDKYRPWTWWKIFE